MNNMEYTLDYLFPGESEVPGFSVELKQLTEEEYKQDITFERIDNFHCEVGEDLLDTIYISEYLAKLITGYLMCKYPHLAKEINRCSNSDILDIKHLFEDNFGDESDVFYEDFCEVVNYTDYSKAQINQVLIQMT